MHAIANNKDVKVKLQRIEHDFMVWPDNLIIKLNFFLIFKFNTVTYLAHKLENVA